MFCREIMSGVESVMYLYWTKKALAKFVYDLIWSLLNWLYHLVADLVRLFWKQWISNLSLLVWPVIFRQYMYRCAEGHFVPLYLSKVCTLNFGGSTKSGTKLILLASTRLYMSDPSMIFKRSFMSSSFRWANSCFDCFADFFWSVLALSNHRGSGLPLDRPYWLLNFALPRSFVRDEVHSRMGTLPFEAWAAFTHMGEWIPMDRWALLFFIKVSSTTLLF